MTISYTESIRGYPYMEKQQLSEEFKMSVQTIKGRVQEIESEIEKVDMTILQLSEMGNYFGSMYLYLSIT